jgi:hypothetical protein
VVADGPVKGVCWYVQDFDDVRGEDYTPLIDQGLGHREQQGSERSGDIPVAIYTLEVCSR